MPDGYSLRIEGLPRLAGRLERTRIALVENTRRAMNLSVLLVESRAKAREAKHTKTGRLFSSIGSSVEGVYGFVTGRVGTSVNYGRYLEFGTGIYGPLHKPITPLSGGFMVFTAYGRRWRLKSVKGQHADPFMRPALEESEGTIREYFADAVREAVE